MRNSNHHLTNDRTAVHRPYGPGKNRRRARYGWSVGTTLFAAAIALAVALVLAACRSSSPPVDPGCPQGSIVALGDSITYGPGLTRVQAYPAQLSAVLHEPVCNAGVNGDRAKGGLARLQRDALQFHPRAVIILFGTNDSGLFATAGKPAVSLDDFRATLAEMVSRVRAGGATAIISSLSPLDAPLLRTAGLSPGNWGAFDGVVRNLASAENIPMIDLNAAFAGNLTLLQDGIHPTAVGAATIAKAAAQVVRTTRPVPAQAAATSPTR